jgi:predicted enzyme involved in methoxymalonyl-ACP biosynthesis
MGKKVEEVLLAYTLAQARAAGAHHLTATPVEGPRNAPAREFFAKYTNGHGAAIDSARVSVPPVVLLREES